MQFDTNVPVPGEQLAQRMLMYAGLISGLPVDALEINALALGPCESATSAVEARLVSSSARALTLTKVPARVHADRPLEVEFASVGLGAGAGVEEPIASWISAHALLQISVESPGQPRGEVPVLVKARTYGSG